MGVFQQPVRLASLRSLINYQIPSSPEYGGRIWDEWESRIKKAHAHDEQCLTGLASSSSSNADSENNEALAEEYALIIGITNNMYAALVVSIWSELEGVLKGICLLLPAEKYSCWDRAVTKFRGMVPFLEPERHQNMSFKFKEISKIIKNKTGVEVSKCPEYHVVNAVRILNNSFKHSNGRYAPKRRHRIEEALRKKWGIEEKESITYSSLPIEEIVVACNAFCLDLLEKVEAKLAM